ncbi:DUF6883 domain-containing protein [Methylobacterium terrae]|uniref:DUF6883 domain-containing protein n=1 Tax=Methylobacterium terrae TaxID=2202827 RepID=UPI00315AC1C1
MGQGGAVRRVLRLPRAPGALALHGADPGGGDDHGGGVGALSEDGWRPALEVPGSKLAPYLLNVDPPNGGPKARFFLAFGFDPAQPEVMADALIVQGHRRSVRPAPRGARVLPPDDRRVTDGDAGRPPATDPQRVAIAGRIDAASRHRRAAHLTPGRSCAMTSSTAATASEGDEAALSTTRRGRSHGW